MLNFTAAIQEVEKAEDGASTSQDGALLANLISYLRENEPSIAKMLEAEIDVEKLSLGDVHVSTALGNDGKKKKPKSFKEMILSATEGRPDKVVDDDTADDTGGQVHLRDTGPTLSKDNPSVDYTRDWTDERTQCQRCSMFVRARNECTLVKGAIEPTAHCKRFEALKQAGWSMPFIITKAEPDKKLVFGWASVAEIGGKLVVDKQNDIITPAELEKAAYEFVLYSRTQGDMHDRKGVGRLVESFMFTKQKQDLLGIDLGLQGWWVGFKVDDESLWNAIKSGERPEFSIGGKGKRVDI